MGEDGYVNTGSVLEVGCEASASAGLFVSYLNYSASSTSSNLGAS
jgi:hypothetical protein